MVDELHALKTQTIKIARSEENTQSSLFVFSAFATSNIEETGKTERKTERKVKTHREDPSFLWFITFI